jgi:hypothetical protein
MAKKTPLQLTQAVRDISVTERATYNKCPRQWELQVLENLEPRVPPTLDLEFGTGIHNALEAYYINVANQASYPDTKEARARPREGALMVWDSYYAETEVRLESIESDLGEATRTQVLDKWVELGDLGEEMIRGYDIFSREEDDFTVHAVEGLITGAGNSWLKKHWEDREFIGEHSASAVIQSGRRLLVPILDPKTKTPLKGKPMLSTRIDLLAHRIDPGMKGLWIYDHKTTTGSPNDRGLDFDDQITAMCYAVWRWLGVAPRGACLNFLVKQAPKDPRILKAGQLSSAKNQLTRADWYREELRDRGLMLKDGTIEDEKYLEAYEALLSRGWDPFFKRFEVTRNYHELQAFEERLYDEYLDMHDSYMGDKMIRPHFSPPYSPWCTYCRVAPICQAIEDGSDVEGIVESRYQDAGDRKALFDVA